MVVHGNGDVGEAVRRIHKHVSVDDLHVIQCEQLAVLMHFLRRTLVGFCFRFHYILSAFLFYFSNGVGVVVGVDANTLHFNVLTFVRRCRSPI